MVVLAWGWVHGQPDSHLSRWYQERSGQGSARLRKLGIVALARKLLIALWRLVAHGEIPPGAVAADWYRKVTGHGAKRRPQWARWSRCDAAARHHGGGSYRSGR
jgi:hypothetical protein